MVSVSDSSADYLWRACLGDLAEHVIFPARNLLFPWNIAQVERWNPMDYGINELSTVNTKITNNDELSISILA